MIIPFIYRKDQFLGCDVGRVGCQIIKLAFFRKELLSQPYVMWLLRIPPFGLQTSQLQVFHTEYNSTLVEMLMIAPPYL